MDVLERHRFLDKYAEEIANAKISFKSVASTTTSSILWTCRNTCCDVISIITTVVPIKSGLMRDIIPENLEPRNKSNRYRKGKLSLLSSPLEEGLVIDVNLVRKKISAKLKAEKKAFMQRLNVSRNIRGRVELNAAVRIQSMYRGYSARCKLDGNIVLCSIQKSVREKLLGYLNSLDNCPPMIKDWNSFRQAYSQKRNLSALIIQCAFRRFVSRRTLSCKRLDMKLYNAHTASIRIQAMSRKAIARIWAKKVANEAKLTLRKNSARKIQNMIRIFLSKRRVQRRRWRLKWVAARMIQCWYRSIRARRLIFVIRKRTLQWKQFFATRKFQCMIRKFLSKKRLIRIKNRALFVKRFKAATCIQRRIRGILSRIRVKKLKIASEVKRNEAAQKKAEQEILAEKAQKDKETKELLQSVDIFYQAKLNRITEVDDILHGRVTEEPQQPDNTDSNGDTILTIAARVGNVEFCRKCILWGCNIHHRNSAGETALMVAVKNHRLEVVEYFIFNCEESVAKLSRDDAGSVLVAAAMGKTADSRSILRALLAKELSPSCQSPELGYTALHGAAEVGDIDAVIMLLKARASADALDDMGQTPLHKACTTSLEVFNYLLQTHGSIFSTELAGESEVGLNIDIASAAGSVASLPGESSPAVQMIKQQSFADPSAAGTPPPPTGSNVSEAGDTVVSDASGKIDWRIGKILKSDQDGKDCLLLAMINGQREVLEICRSILEGSGMPYNAPEEIGWTPNDIVRATELARNGNIACLEQLLSAGFDPVWAVEETGMTLAMIACKYGQREVIDLVMSKGIDLSVVDTVKNWSAMHYAATCKSQAMVHYLLTHSNATTCKISEQLLTTTDTDGRTPLHIAAVEGVSLSLPDEMEAVVKPLIEINDKGGLSPLLLASTYLNGSVIHEMIRAGARPKSTVDKDGHDALWHVFHPDLSVYKTRARPVIGSEYVSRTKPADTLSYLGGSLTRREDAIRLADDIEIVTSLVRRGCSLYSTALAEAADVEAYLFNKSYREEVMSSATGMEMNTDIAQCGEILIREKSIILLRSLPDVCSVPDAWRLLISCILLDTEPGCPCLSALVEGGLLDTIFNGSKIELVTAATAQDAVSEIFSRTLTASPIVHSPKPASAGKPKVDVKAAFESALQLHSRSMLGWAILANNDALVNYLLDLGIEPAALIDQEGNNALHYAAKFGTATMVSRMLQSIPIAKVFASMNKPKSDKKLFILNGVSVASVAGQESSKLAAMMGISLNTASTNSSSIRLEATNNAGRTAAMEAAIRGDVKVLREFVMRKASARTALSGKYWAFVLALARRQEAVEFNGQTGLIENDDIKYHCVAPDPYYIVWWKEK